MKFKINRKKSLKDQDSRFKILYSHKPMHYNGTEIDTNIQYQYLHAHDKMMDVTQQKHNKEGERGD